MRRLDFAFWRIVIGAAFLVVVVVIALIVEWLW